MLSFNLSRRDLLGGITAGLTGALLSSRALGPDACRPARASSPDIHRHFVSPAYLKVLNAKQGHKVEGFTSFFPLGPWQNYSPPATSKPWTSRVSPPPSSPPPHRAHGSAENRDRNPLASSAPEMNEYGAKMASDYKGRFGLFALLPMPSVDDCLKEIEYALDTLKADGIGLLTSYGARYLGDPAFQPIFDELNRRKAVVYTHPIDAPCCQDITLTGVTPTTLEFPTDTTRAILSLIASAPNAAAIYGDAAMPISASSFSHGGGTLPAIIGRVGVGGPDDLGDNLAKPAAPNSRLFHLRRFYYDTAMATNPVQIQALKTIAGASQILFGTDYPFGGDAVKHRQGLEKCGLSRGEAPRHLPRKTRRGSSRSSNPESISQKRHSYYASIGDAPDAGGNQNRPLWTRAGDAVSHTVCAVSILWCLATVLFRIRVEGAENIPLTGAALLVSNHISYADAVLVGYATPRIVRFLMWKPIYEARFFS